jgi:hypothetical protein
MVNVMNESIKTKGTIGTENVIVDQCPCYIPKENIEFFKNMSKSMDSNTHTTPNDYWNITGSSWKGGK